jgi:hypothetical protein
MPAGTIAGAKSFAGTANMELNGKPIQFVASAGWEHMYGGLEAALYISTAYQLLQKHPYDMLVFEMPDKTHYQVRLAGYPLNTGELDETTVIFRTKSLEIKMFWLKIDDYGDKYVGTFLFPEDY